MGERIWVCEECNHIFTDEQKQQHDAEQEWGHPCHAKPLSKKPWLCESFRKPYVEEGTP